MATLSRYVLLISGNVLIGLHQMWLTLSLLTHKCPHILVETWHLVQAHT